VDQPAQRHERPAASFHAAWSAHLRGPRASQRLLGIVLWLALCLTVLRVGAPG
jgi:hypothetical protein